jgi:hypothetical protein
MEFQLSFPKEVAVVKSIGFKLTVATLTGAALVALMWGCTPAMETPSGLNSKGQTVDKAYSSEIATVDLPSLDSAVPSNFETASFGLG